MDTKDKDLLELFIDRYGVYNTVSTMASICEDKADPGQTNWKDKTLVRVWSTLATKLTKALPDLERVEL